MEVSYDIEQLEVWNFFGQVYAGAKPFVEKVINHLAEGLMEALLNVFTENKTKVLKSLDVQGYCQLMLEVHVDFHLVSKVAIRNLWLLLEASREMEIAG